MIWEGLVIIFLGMWMIFIGLRALSWLTAIWRAQATQMEQAKILHDLLVANQERLAERGRATSTKLAAEIIDEAQTRD